MAGGRAPVFCVFGSGLCFSLSFCCALVAFYVFVHSYYHSPPSHVVILTRTLAHWIHAALQLCHIRFFTLDLPRYQFANGRREYCIRRLRSILQRFASLRQDPLYDSQRPHNFLVSILTSHKL